MAHSRGRFQGRTTSRRLTGWEQGPGQVGAQTEISASVQTLAALGTSVIVDGFTIIRVRGRFHAYLTNANSANEGFSGAFGIGVVTTAAFVAGAASVPGPVTESAWEGWMFHQWIQMLSPAPMDGGVAADLDQQAAQTAVQIFDIDSKAMRKFRSDETIFGCLEVVEAGTATMRWHLNSRMLLKLP